MGENTENLQGQNTAPAKEKLGCMGCIGVLLLLAAIGAAGWFFIAKTVLEEKGVDVDGKIEEIKAHSKPKSHISFSLLKRYEFTSRMAVLRKPWLYCRYARQFC